MMTPRSVRCDRCTQLVPFTWAVDVAGFTIHVCDDDLLPAERAIVQPSGRRAADDEITEARPSQYRDVDGFGETVR